MPSSETIRARRHPEGHQHAQSRCVCLEVQHSPRVAVGLPGDRFLSFATAFFWRRWPLSRTVAYDGSLLVVDRRRPFPRRQCLRVPPVTRLPGTAGKGSHWPGPLAARQSSGLMFFVYLLHFLREIEHDEEVERQIILA